MYLLQRSIYGSQGSLKLGRDLRRQQRIPMTMGSDWIGLAKMAGQLTDDEGDEQKHAQIDDILQVKHLKRISGSRKEVIETQRAADRSQTCPAAVHPHSNQHNS